MHYLAQQKRANDVAGGLGSAGRTLRMALQSAVLGVGAYLVIQQEATAGIIIASSILSGRALAPIDLAIANWKGFVSARQGWRRLDELLAAMPPSATRLELPAPAQTLSLDALSVAPPGAKAPVVQDIRFTLKAGSALGIVGPSASGKSSLVRAIVGVWPRVRGCVRLDGATIDQWTAAARGRHIGYLPQDVELFEGTVAQNIARFDQDPPAAADNRRGPGRRRARPDRQPARRLRDRARRARARRCLPDSGSALRSPARFTASRSWSCSTSPIPISMPKARRRSPRPFSACARAAAS